MKRIIDGRMYDDQFMNEIGSRSFDRRDEITGETKTYHERLYREYVLKSGHTLEDTWVAGQYGRRIVTDNCDLAKGQFVLKVSQGWSDGIFVPLSDDEARRWFEKHLPDSTDLYAEIFGTPSNPWSGDGTVALHIAVKDTGCGIPPERLAHLFDPREDDGAGRGCPGPGLGLSVVKRLLDSCGGAIDIDSAVGRGTGVYIRIGRLALADRPDEPAAKIAMPTVPDDFGVLVVDDVGVNLKVLALRVRKTGIKDVRTASSGEEALRLFAERRPHLVLTDLWMPGMDGVALAAAIRREGGTMPIVAITADSDARTSFDMSEFDGIITKPVSHDKLRAVIARAAKSIRPQQSAGRAQTKAQP